MVNVNWVDNVTEISTGSGKLFFVVPRLLDYAIYFVILSRRNACVAELITTFEIVLPGNSNSFKRTYSDLEAIVYWEEVHGRIKWLKKLREV